MTPAPTDKYCPRCRQWLHRKMFRALVNHEIVPDTVCKPCRKAMGKESSPQVLMRRAEKGRLDPDRLNDILERRKAVATDRLKKTLLKKKEIERAKTWRGLFYALRLVRITLNEYTWDTPEKEAWREKALALVNEAREIAHNRKGTVTCPYGDRPPWYAPLPQGVRVARNLMNEYPEGADKSPLKVL